MKADYTIQGSNNQMSVQILDENMGNFGGFESVEKSIFDPNLGQKTDKFNDIAKINNIVPGDGERDFSLLDNITNKRSNYENMTRRFSLQNSARELLPNERVAGCLRSRIFAGRPVEVYKALMFKAAFYANLQTCGSIWSCPVCASKITERRRLELQQGVNNWRGRALLLTLTLQHSVNDSLEVVLLALLNTYSNKLIRGRFWVDLKRDFGLVGTIRTLEVTHGVNGWHPHGHVLLFSEHDKIDFELLHKRLFEKWEYELHAIGRYTNKKAFDLQYSNQAVADYVAKWGLADSGGNDWNISHEMTKNPVKIAKNGGYTPFALLESSAGGNEAHGRLFQEYFRAFKGKRQLRYSRGLKELLGLADKSDEQICDEKIEQSYLFMVLSREQWRQVLGNDIRAELLQQVAEGDIQSVVAYLSQFGIEWE